MRSGIIAFVIGVVILQTLSSLPSAATMFSGFLIALAGFSISQRLHARIRSAIRCAAACLLGMIWAAFFATCYLSQDLQKEWEGRDIVVDGTLDS